MHNNKKIDSDDLDHLQRLAHKIFRRWYWTGVLKDDLVQAGALAVVKARSEDKPELRVWDLARVAMQDEWRYWATGKKGHNYSTKMQVPILLPLKELRYDY